MEDSDPNTDPLTIKPTDLPSVIANKNLIREADKGNAEAIRKLLDEGADPSYLDYEAFYTAVEKCHLEATKLLIDYMDYLDPGILFRSPIFNSNIELVELLIERGADIHKAIEPLVMAVRGQSDSMLEYLKGLGLRIEDASVKESEAMFSACLGSNNLKVLQILLESNPSLAYKSDSFPIAALGEVQRLDVACHLLDIAYFPDPTSEDFHSMVNVAIITYNLELLKHMVKCEIDLSWTIDAYLMPKFDPDILIFLIKAHREFCIEEANQSSLKLITRSAHSFDIFKAFIEIGVSCDSNENIACEAILFNNYPLLEYLFTQGLEISPKIFDAAVTTLSMNLEELKVLHGISSNMKCQLASRLPMFKILVENGFDLTYKPKVLIKALTKLQSKLDLVKYLGESGLDLATNSNYLMRFSAINGDIETLRYLVDLGEDLNSKGSYISKRFGMGTDLLYIEVLEYLLEHCEGFSLSAAILTKLPKSLVDSKGLYDLIESLMERDILVIDGYRKREGDLPSNLMQLLFEKGNFGPDPLKSAMINDFLELAIFIEDQIIGSSHSESSSDFDTSNLESCLIVASITRANSIARYLISKYSNQVIDKIHHVFHRYIQMGDIEMIKFLIDKGIDYEYANCVAIRLAAHNCRDDIVKLLLDKGVSEINISHYKMGFTSRDVEKYSEFIASKSMEADSIFEGEYWD